MEKNLNKMPQRDVNYFALLHYGVYLSKSEFSTTPGIAGNSTRISAQHGITEVKTITELLISILYMI